MGSNKSKSIKNGSKFSDISNQINDLDLILFADTDLISRGIRFMQYIMNNTDKWSHVGLVVSKRTIPFLNVPDNDLYVLESTMSSKLLGLSDTMTIPDAESGKYVFGVQIRKLKDVIKGYTKSGRVGWARLINNPILKNEDESFLEYNNRMQFIKNTMTNLHQKYYHRHYELNVCNCIGAFDCCYKLSCNNCCSSDDKYILCSEIVAIYYKELGIIDKNIDTNKILPADLYQSNTSIEYFQNLLPNKLVDDAIELYI